jgi:small subunit ribosomal protein S4
MYVIAFYVILTFLLLYLIDIAILLSDNRTMGRYTGPKDRLSRREGKELFGRTREALKRRLNQPPGDHGARSRGRLSVYGTQFREKQKVKRIYGLREKQFRNLFEEALKSRDGTTGTSLLQRLEMRLDNVVYRLGLAKTRPQARQYVSQGHVLVDGEKVDIPSYRVKAGERVTLTPEMFSNPQTAANVKEITSLPEWLEVSEGAGKVLRPPTRDEIDKDINEDLIVAFYTR